MSQTSSFSAHIGRCALRGALHEVTVVGKPGLVCPEGSGAHRDMDITTLMLSALTLEDYFCKATALGIRLCAEEEERIFAALRPLGLAAEEHMLAATHGVNTHKGLIFSMGLLCGAAGVVQGQGRECKPKDLCATAMRMVQGIVARDFARIQQGLQPVTAGERFYLATGHAGIRAEAEAGFPHVLKALAIFTGAKGRQTFNTSCLQALLWLMSSVPDTNVWHRGGAKGLATLQKKAGAIVAMGLDKPEGQEALKDLQDVCLKERLSPGGCADLLAVALFLYFLST